MAKKAEVKRRAHKVVPSGELCSLCFRTGAELNIECPGYQTAAEYVEWKQRSKPKAKGRR